MNAQYCCPGIILLLLTIFLPTKYYCQNQFINRANDQIAALDFEAALVEIAKAENASLSQKKLMRLNNLKAFCLYRIYKYDESLEVLKQNSSIQLFAQSDKEELIKTFNYLAFISFAQEELELANHYIMEYERLAANIQNDNNIVKGNLLLLKGRYALLKQEFDKAEIFLEEAVLVTSNIDVKSKEILKIEISAHIYLGDLLYNQGLPESIAEYEKAWKLSDEYDFEILFYNAFISYSRGKNAFVKRQYKESHEHYSEALKLYERLPYNDYLRISVVHHSIAILYNLQWDNGASIIHLNHSLVNLTQVFPRNHRSFVPIYLTLGNTYLYGSQTKKAMDFLGKAKDAELANFGEEREKISFIYYGFGSVHFNDKNYEEALYWYTKSLESYNRIVKNENLLKWTINNAIASCYSKMRIFNKALSLHKFNLELLERVSKDDTNSRAFTIGNIGVNLRCLQEFDESLKYIHESICLTVSNFNNPDVETIPPISVKASVSNVYIYLLCEKAKTFFDRYSYSGSQMNDLILAKKTINHAKDVINHTYRQHITDLSKLSLSHQFKADVYEWGIKINYKLFEITKDEQYLFEIFEYMKESKNKLLLEDISKNTAFILPLELQGKEQQLRSNIRKLEQGINADIGLDSIAAQLVSEYAAYENLLDTIQFSFPKYFELVFSNQEVALGDIKRNLSENEGIVEYFFGDSTIFALFTSKDKIEIALIPIYNDSTNDLEMNSLLVAFEEYFELLKKPVLTKVEQKVILDLGHIFYLKFIACFKGISNIKKLKIIRDGYLHYIPFETFVKNKNNGSLLDVDYLLKEYVISYELSSNLYYNRTAISSAKDFQVLSMAPTFAGYKLGDIQKPIVAIRDGAMPSLIGAENEAEMVYDKFGGHLYLKEDATKKSFLSKAESHEIIHLATHSVTDPFNPMFSKILFSIADDKENAPLYAHELYSLSLNNKLTVLSSCSTSDGALEKGEGIMSVARGFISAGSRSLITSPWAVSDQYTPEIMEYFYSNLKNGQDKDIALSDAKMKFLEGVTDNNKFPFYWSGFILIGDTSPIVNDNFSNQSVWLLLIGAVLFLYLLKNWKN